MERILRKSSSNIHLKLAIFDIFIALVHIIADFAPQISRFRVSLCFAKIIHEVIVIYMIFQ
jgi:hypothetical protein